MSQRARQQQAPPSSLWDSLKADGADGDGGEGAPAAGAAGTEGAGGAGGFRFAF